MPPGSAEAGPRRSKRAREAPAGEPEGPSTGVPRSAEAPPVQEGQASQPSGQQSPGSSPAG